MIHFSGHRPRGEIGGGRKKDPEYIVAIEITHTITHTNALNALLGCMHVSQTFMWYAMSIQVGIMLQSIAGMLGIFD